MATKVVIMGAAGSDFHTFNVYFRDNENYEVVAFTMAAEQNLGTTEEGFRSYPPELAGKLYPNGIPFYPESKLEEVIKKYDADHVVFAYHDVSYNFLMQQGSRALAAGASFKLFGSKVLMLKSTKPVIAITAVRTGSGKSQTSRKVVDILKKKGKKVVAIREPMPYGDLVKQTVMRFETYEDLDKHGCTIEEREEYEPYIERGMVIYSGVDYEKILHEAEKEADIVVWDGGNNEISYYIPDLLFVIADPLRPGHEISYHAGEINARTADYVIINKEDSAKKKDIDTVIANIKDINPKAKIIHANSKISVEDPEVIKGKKVLVIEDGPTLTHGGMNFGAGTVAAKKYNAKVVSPERYAKGSLKEVFRKYKNLSNVLPAMGYSEEQIREMETIINSVNCDAVISGTPIDLSKILKVNKPIVRVRYDLEEKGEPNLETVLKEFVEKL